MNTVALQSKLFAILKKNGVSDYHEKSISALNNKWTKEGFLRKVEALYVISRLINPAGPQNLVKRMTQANIQWIGYLVDTNQGPSQLNEYIHKYGPLKVKQAIEYMIKTGIWESPQGDKYLHGASPADLYEGLKEIDKTVAFMDAEDMFISEPKEKKEEKKEEENNEVVQKETPQETPQEEMSYGSAKEELQLVMKLAEALPGRLQRLEHVLLNDSLTEMFAKENRDLIAEIDNLKQKLEASENLNKNSAREIESLKTDLSKAKTVIDGLAQKNEELTDQLCKPRKRVIPVSKLLEIPFIGMKTIKLLSSFFEPYDIFFDEKK